MITGERLPIRKSVLNRILGWLRFSGKTIRTGNAYGHSRGAPMCKNITNRILGLHRFYTKPAAQEEVLPLERGSPSV